MIEDHLGKLNRDIGRVHIETPEEDKQPGMKVLNLARDTTEAAKATRTAAKPEPDVHATATKYVIETDETVDTRLWGTNVHTQLTDINPRVYTPAIGTATEVGRSTATRGRADSRCAQGESHKTIIAHTSTPIGEAGAHSTAEKNNFKTGEVSNVLAIVNEKIMVGRYVCKLFFSKFKLVAPEERVKTVDEKRKTQDNGNPDFEFRKHSSEIERPGKRNVESKVAKTKGNLIGMEEGGKAGIASLKTTYVTRRAAAPEPVS